MRLWQLVVLAGAGFLLSCAEVNDARQDDGKAVIAQFTPANVTSQQELVAKGQRLARIMGCKGCHEANLAGKIWINEPEFAVQYAANLTRMVGDYSDNALANTIRTGRRPDGTALWEMPSEAFQHLSAPDMKALIAFLRTLKPEGEPYPRPVLGPDARQEIADGLWLSAPQQIEMETGKAPLSVGRSHEQGRYVARMACGECHGAELSGNPEPYRPDLAVASGYSLPQFKALMRTGKALDERDIGLMGQVAPRRFTALTDAEIEVLYRYLVARAQQPAE